MSDWKAQQRADSFMDELLTASVLRGPSNSAADVLDAVRVYERLFESEPAADLAATIAACYDVLYSRDLLGPTQQHADKALSWSRKAVDLEPDNAVLHESLATTLSLIHNEYAEAVAHYRRAIEIQPYLVDAANGLAWLYNVPEQVVSIEEAVRCKELTVRPQPFDPNLWISLARLYRNAGREVDSLRALRTVLLLPRPLENWQLKTIKAELGVEDAPENRLDEASRPPAVESRTKRWSHVFAGMSLLSTGLAVVLGVLAVDLVEGSHLLGNGVFLLALAAIAEWLGLVTVIYVLAAVTAHKTIAVISALFLALGGIGCLFLELALSAGLDYRGQPLLATYGSLLFVSQAVSLMTFRHRFMHQRTAVGT